MCVYIIYHSIILRRWRCLKCTLYKECINKKIKYQFSCSIKDCQVTFHWKWFHISASSINTSFSGSLPNHYIIILLLHVHVMYDLCSCVCNGRIMCNSWENKLLLSLDACRVGASTRNLSMSTSLRMSTSTYFPYAPKQWKMCKMESDLVG